jgi:FtsH-binding integral membrane protein
MNDDIWTRRDASRPGYGASLAAGIDVGLRDYMLRVYNYMAGGLAITGLVAYLAAESGLYAAIARTPFIWVVVFAPLAVVLLFSFRLQAMSLQAAQATFWAYAGLMGLSLSYIFLVYTGASIAQTFFVSAATFLAMSLYGYTTRTDLSRFGSFLLMGLVGIIIAGLVNLFVGSPAITFAISVIGVLVFVGLTAYDTQRIKEMYWEGDVGAIAGKKAIMGALTLYLDFINLFILLMQFMGQRRD